MLKDREAMATIAVKDFAAARKFYEGTLGLEPASVEESIGLATYKSGGSSVIVYKSEFAGTNKATSATWGVGDELDAIVGALDKAGVRFDHYDMPGMERSGHVHGSGDFKAVWFRDPEGNILHLNNM